MNLLSFLLFPAFLLPLSFSCAPPLSPPSTPRPFTKIFAFGDSFTDTGNYNNTPGGPYPYSFVSNPPYGSTYFHHPSHRFSDGRLVVDFLASALDLPFLPPYLHPASNSSSHGVNFAIAFSSAIDVPLHEKQNDTFSPDPMPAPLSMQLQWFDDYLEGNGCLRGGSPECRDVLEGALFWVGEIGFDDYVFGINSTWTLQYMQQQAVHGVVHFLQEILNKGAKHIIVQGLPAIGCLPLLLAMSPPEDRGGNGCYSRINVAVDSHNSLLQDELHDLRRRHPAAAISYADFFNAHLAVIDNPGASGFEDPFMTCCGEGGAPYNFEMFAMCGSIFTSEACSEPSKRVNWDGIHLTEAMNQRLARMFFHGNYCKPSFDVLLGIREV